MKVKISKKQNGFVVSEAILAILILIMFTGIITSLIYNIVLNSKRVKISSQEIAYITDVFNHTEIIKYNDVTEEKLIAYVNNKAETKNSLSAGQDLSVLTTPYKMRIEVETYIPEDKTNGTKDLVKTIKVRVECVLAKKTYATEMNTVRQIKNLELEELL